MAIGAAVGTAVSEEEPRNEECGVGADAVAGAEVFVEGHRGGGDRDRVLRESDESDVFDREGEQEPAGPFPGAEGGAGGPQTEGDEGAEESKAEKRAPAVGALAAAAAAPNGGNLFGHAFGSSAEGPTRSARGSPRGASPRTPAASAGPLPGTSKAAATRTRPEHSPAPPRGRAVSTRSTPRSAEATT
ncbi:unnamed protein product [Urochloa humidicola]